MWESVLFVPYKAYRCTVLLQNVLILIPSPSPCANTKAKQFYINIYSSSKTTCCQLWYHVINQPA